MMMEERDPRHARGRAGEEITLLFLEARGYRLLARRFRAGRRELDLVVERGALLVAVEVKWRRAGENPEQVLGAWRRGQRARAGGAVFEAMAQLPGGEARPWRFDLVTIEERGDGFDLTHRRGAWSPGDSFW
jgi:putative endonuclease